MSIHDKRAARDIEPFAATGNISAYRVERCSWCTLDEPDAPATFVVLMLPRAGFDGPARLYSSCRVHSRDAVRGDLTYAFEVAAHAFEVAVLLHQAFDVEPHAYAEEAA